MKNDLSKQEKKKLHCLAGEILIFEYKKESNRNTYLSFFILRKSKGLWSFFLDLGSPHLCCLMFCACLHLIKAMILFLFSYVRSFAQAQQLRIAKLMSVEEIQSLHYSLFYKYIRHTTHYTLQHEAESDISEAQVRLSGQVGLYG